MYTNKILIEQIKVFLQKDHVNEMSLKRRYEVIKPFSEKDSKEFIKEYKKKPFLFPIECFDKIYMNLNQHFQYLFIYTYMDEILKRTKEFNEISIENKRNDFFSWLKEHQVIFNCDHSFYTYLKKQILSEKLNISLLLNDVFPSIIEETLTLQVNDLFTKRKKNLLNLSPLFFILSNDRYLNDSHKITLYELCRDNNIFSMDLYKYINVNNINILQEIYNEGEKIKINQHISEFSGQKTIHKI